MLMPRAVLRRHGRVRWVLTQALIVAVGVFFYFQVRGLTNAEPSVAVRHAHRLMDLEQWLGLRFELALQARVIAYDSLYDIANWIYVWGHWPVIVATMLWLALQHRHIFLRLRDGMLASGAVGLVIFVTYPVAPPRLVDPDLVDTVTERSEAYRYLQPPNFVNQYAALPSLHAGWDLLVGISIATAAGTLAGRVVGCVLPTLMSLAVIATANHYVIDVIAGIALALLGHVVALRLERRRARRARPSTSGRALVSGPT